MPQFFVPRKNLRGTFFVFPPSESWHLAKVLRKKPGDFVQIFDGEGLIASAQITDLSDPNAVKAKWFPQKGTCALGQGGLLHLYPALIRNECFEWMLEKVTELGVSSIHPLFTERTIVKIPPARRQMKVKRWEKILLSAAKQCGRENLPQLVPPLDFKEAIRQCENYAIHLILWEGEEKKSLSDFLATCHLPLTAVDLFVGPEGGFTIEEVECAKKAGFQSVRLGKNILRAETAAIAAISLLLLI